MDTFTFAPNLNLRAIDRDGQPWFVAADVCRALDIAPYDGVRRIEECDKARLNLGLRGQAPYVINESGLYSLIMQSRKPEAKAFQRWVTSEVLPAIRKNGGYMTPEVAVQAVEDPAVFMARALVMARKLSPTRATDRLRRLNPGSCLYKQIRVSARAPVCS